MSHYDAPAIEKKWQAIWEDTGCFTASQISANQNIMCWKCFPIRLTGYTGHVPTHL